MQIEPSKTSFNCLKVLTLFLLIFILATESKSQWIVQNSGTLNTLKSVFFTDDQNGIITGDHGTILKTIDGGALWTMLDAGTTSSLNSVFFVDTDTGYIAGDNGVILKTSDGGTTWESQNSGTTSNLRSIRFADNNTGYVSGINAVIAKTTNAGINWSLFAAPGNGRLSTVDTNTVYLVGEGLSVFKTNDGAQNWDTVLWNSSYGALNDVCFNGPANGIVVGGSWAQGYSYSVVYYTQDGGSNWHTWLKINSGWLNSVTYADTSIAYAVGSDGIVFQTSNSGEQWDRQVTGTSNDLFSVHFPTSETGYIAGESGTILKTVNGGVGIGEELSVENQMLFSPNPSNSYLTIILPINTDKGVLKMFDNQGKLVMSENVHSQKHEMDVSCLKKGIYCVIVETSGKNYFSRMIKD